MHKLISELESALENYELNFGGTQYDDGMVSGLETAIQIVKAHNPWHDVSELPPLCEFGRLSDTLLVKGAKSGEISTGYYRAVYKEWHVDYGNFTVTHWTYLPEQSK